MSDLTIAQEAERRNVSTSTVRRWLKQGLPHIKVGGIIRIPEEDEEKWIDRRKRIPILDERILRKILTNPAPALIDIVKGGQKVARKKTRHNYGYGSVYVRKTKKGASRAPLQIGKELSRRPTGVLYSWMRSPIST